MKSFIPVCVTALTLANCAVADTEQEIATLITHMEANGCVTTEREAEDALYEAGLNDENAFVLLGGLLHSRDAVIFDRGNSVALQTGDVCGDFSVELDPFDSEIVTQIVAAYEASLCVLRLESWPLEALADRFGEDRVFAALSHLLNSGEIAASQNYKTRYTGGEICGQ